MASVEKYTTKAGPRYKVRYRTPDGRSTDKSGFKTKRDAEAWEAENLLARRSGTFVSESARRVLMGTLIEQYLARTAGLAPTTRSNRASIAANWVTPDWSAWQVGAVQRSDVKAWVERIHSQPRQVLRGARMVSTAAGAATVEKAHAILYGVLQEAVNDGLLAANPAARVGLPRPLLRPHPYLTNVELLELADAADPRDRTLILVLGLMGLRFGEAAALKRQVLWLERRRLRVELAVTEDEGRLIWGPPKTHEIRTVAVPGLLSELLAERGSRTARLPGSSTSRQGSDPTLGRGARAFAGAHTESHADVRCSCIAGCVGAASPRASRRPQRE
jgi:integrase